MSIVGYGKAFSSFGELVQGRTSDGEDFLVTLPIDLWSTCTVHRRHMNGASKVICDLEKSRAVAERMLGRIGLEGGEQLTIEFTRNIPIGKGLSSSTADMLAVVRGLQEIYGVIVSEQFISRLFAEVEPHDAIHYYMSVIYNHRRGVLIQKLYHIPEYYIIALDRDGEVDTVQYNDCVAFNQSDLLLYDRLLSRIAFAFSRRDDLTIAQCATKSAEIHAKRMNDPWLLEVIDYRSSVKALAVVAAHSGTCTGLLFPRDLSRGEVRRLEGKISDDLGCKVFSVRTLRILT